MGDTSGSFIREGENPWAAECQMNCDSLWGNCKVAIKVVPISHTLQQQSRHSLSREVNALQTTYKHPNVIQLYESFRSPSRLYLVLELASRGDLLEHINRRAERSRLRGLCEAEAQQMFQQLVGAVSHCHTKHIAHRYQHTQRDHHTSFLNACALSSQHKPAGTAHPSTDHKTFIIPVQSRTQT
ncbi:testis-specific serine/threonine-protein kinase 5-like [Hypanus sabinus]|uniref:testis-specific serine/threonine-protein kinase 5-like n=1 Tax=Hypanus sabinus TaxID=79690 RepID=UPI0028C4BAE0|nr:testis-specific serine/threonine-protein kinase 5-like [Hypanus sabinus]